MSSLHVRPITCPLCATSWEGWLVLAGRSDGPLSSELRRFPEDEDPLPKMINSCPSCGYAGEVSAFEEMAPQADKPVPASQTGAWFAQEEWEDAHDPMIADRPHPTTSTLAEQLATHLAERATEANEDPALRYEHHGQVERWLGHGPLREGDAFLRAAWMYDDTKRPEDALRCRKRAIACYRRGVDERKWFARREDLVVIAYLVGELHRKLGEADEAKRWFEQAIAWSSGLQKMQELVELAERQASDPREVV